MKLKTIRLDDQTRSVLLRSNIDGNRLTLPGQLERADYQRVAKAIEAAGGKWNRKEQCHVFPNPVHETMDITADTVAVTNLQQTYQSFYTPPAIAKRMALIAGGITGLSGKRILEPSAGTGNLIIAAVNCVTGFDCCRIVAIDIDPRRIADLEELRRKHLTADPLNFQIIKADFLALPTLLDLGPFDIILMNPPFSRRDDIRHIRHALNFLKPGGKLVAVCADGPSQQNDLGPIADDWLPLEPGSFRESGTDVATAIIVITK